MPVAYTPGLRVAASTALRQTRRLPMRGEVLVRAGDLVSADRVVARAQRPGNAQVVRAAQALHLEPNELQAHLVRQPGEAVQAGEVIARTQGLWGLLKNEVRSPVAGMVEEVSPTTGYIRLREPPTIIELLAHVAGRVVQVIEGEGAVIEARGALVQGIFGVGGERRGRLRRITEGREEALRADAISDATLRRLRRPFEAGLWSPAKEGGDTSLRSTSCQGCVLIAGSGADGEAISRAAEAGAAGLVVGAVSDEALRRYVGYDIGVAITGQEAVPMTLIVTEGFGELPMARRTWDLLTSLEGELASINGATQIRAGVIRPEIIVTREAAAAGEAEEAQEQVLAVGSAVRVIRDPHFGALGHVVALPPELTEIETESRVRIALVKLDRGDEVRVPRANLELIQE